EAIAREVSSLHAEAGEAGRFAIEGPPVQLTPKAATAMALALHELATNAAKYGALATPRGRVALTWAIKEVAGGRRLELTWRERGGPRVAPPTHVGFGTRLITRGLKGELGAEVRLDYAPEGLTC